MSQTRSGCSALELVVLMLALGSFVGCGGVKAPTAPPPRPIGPLAIHRPDSPLVVFSGEAETPGSAYSFDFATGSVRVTMEVDTGPGSAATPSPPSFNDVLFKAEGQGRISVAFKRPWPEHPNGRVTIRCESGGEESSAEFEPELWYHQSGAIVTLEASPGDSVDLAHPGKEIILGRYVARNIPRDIRLTFKAVFSQDPVAPRTKAGLKPLR